MKAEVFVKPEVRASDNVAVGFAANVRFEIAVRFEFEVDSNCHDVSWAVGIFGSWRWVVRVSSKIECI